MKKIIHTLHLWLGLGSGLVVFILAVTGCIYAFEAEIQGNTQSFRYVPTQEKEFISPSRFKIIAQKALPGKTIHSVQYADKKTAVVITFFSFTPAYYYLIYADPFTGKILKVKDMDKDFFRFILLGHYYLWLPPEIGQPIAASATLVFVVMMISGLVLWWPKNKSALKQRYKVKWDAKWRRKNYDLHNVLGFYAIPIGLVFAVTGLVMGFQWFAKTVYWTASGGKSMVEYSEPLSAASKAVRPAGYEPVDILWKKTVAENPVAKTIEVHYPENGKSAIGISANSDATTYWKGDHRYYDQYTLKEIPVKHTYGKYSDDLSVADKIMRMNYDIHIGAILGLPGKIVAFAISLIIASLPVTGFVIWWGRKKKTKKSVVRNLTTASR